MAIVFKDYVHSVLNYNKSKLKKIIINKFKGMDVATPKASPCKQPLTLQVGRTVTLTPTI